MSYENENTSMVPKKQQSRGSHVECRPNLLKRICGSLRKPGITKVLDELEEDPMAIRKRYTRVKRKREKKESRLDAVRFFDNEHLCGRSSNRIWNCYGQFLRKQWSSYGQGTRSLPWYPLLDNEEPSLLQQVEEKLKVQESCRLESFLEWNVDNRAWPTANWPGTFREHTFLIGKGKNQGKYPGNFWRWLMVL